MSSTTVTISPSVNRKRSLASQLIEIRNLSYTYPNSSKPALKDVNLEISPGEFVLLTGPSGSGKSTLLRCLNGLVPHFSGGVISGAVKVAGMDVLLSGPHYLSGQVGFVSQSPEAQAVLDKVEPEIAFGLENAAVPPQEMRIRVEEVLDLLDLTPLRNRSMATLSGGERQRVSIAAALAFRPRILLLDEPTSQLDPQSAESVLRALVRLNEDLGLTVVLAEHRLERVIGFADRIVYLENGEVTHDGEPGAVISGLPLLPPIARLGRVLGWHPLPLNVKEARQMLRNPSNNLTNGRGTTLANLDTPNDFRARRSVGQPGAEAGSALVEVRDLSFSYNGCKTLQKVTLEVNPGEAVALLGRNGAGKSTLLKCILGLLSPEAGSVIVGERTNQGRSVAEICRDIAYLPQSPDDLLFAETVADELGITLKNHALPVSETAIKAMLGQLDLQDTASEYPRDLSVGQRQRVAFGAVAITNPNLILLDEPTRGLDYAAKQVLVKLWRSWLGRGAGLLLVTHDVELAAAIADRVLLMSEGEIIASGPAGEVLSTSPMFMPEIAKLFPERGWLTVEDAVAGLQYSN